MWTAKAPKLTQQATPIGQVFETKNYDLFSFLVENRQLNSAHVAQLVKSMQEEVLLSPIIVNEDYNIIDGQHRFEARRNLNLPIPYFVCPGYGLGEVQRLNSVNRVWKNVDFVESFASLGYESYSRIKQLNDAYPAIPLVTIMLVVGERTNQSTNFLYYFRRGEFVLNDFAAAKQKLTELNQINKYWSFANTKTFSNAYIQCRATQGFKYTKFIDKVKKFGSLGYRCNNTKLYMDMIHDVYNYQQGQKLNLRKL